MDKEMQEQIIVFFLNVLQKQDNFLKHQTIKNEDLILDKHIKFENFEYLKDKKQLNTIDAINSNKIIETKLRDSSNAKNKLKNKDLPFKFLRFNCNKMVESDSSYSYKAKDTNDIKLFETINSRTGDDKLIVKDDNPFITSIENKLQGSNNFNTINHIEETGHNISYLPSIISPDRNDYIKTIEVNNSLIGNSIRNSPNLKSNHTKNKSLSIYTSLNTISNTISNSINTDNHNKIRFKHLKSNSISTCNKSKSIDKSKNFYYSKDLKVSLDNWDNVNKYNEFSYNSGKFDIPLISLNGGI